MQDWVGQQLGNYRLLRQLGRGGFGQVYLGEHIYLKTQAAIKLVLEDVNEAQVAAFRTDFLQEAQRIAVLKHPHILRVLEFGMENATPYLVMEYAAHGTLLERHLPGSKVPVDQVVHYTKQIAQALQHAHKSGLIHRDVKPANILLDENDTVLLSDFGIATITHHTSSMHTGAYAGTAIYMAPEQLQGRPVPASDQYASAIMVYQWLTGQFPYQGDPIAVGMQHLMAPIPSLLQHNSALSPAIESVVHQAMSKDPRQRFATMLDFAAALEQALQKTYHQPSTPTTMHTPVTALPPTVQANSYPPLTSSQSSSIRQLQGEGEVFYAQEKYQESLAAFNAVLQIDPGNGRADGWKGAALYQLKLYPEALTAREQALQKGETNKENYQGKGESLYQLTRYTEALTAFNQAIQINPDYARAHAWKGDALYQLKRHTEALTAFNQAIQIDPDYAWAYGWKGATLYQLKQYPEALIAREQALQKGNTNKETYQGKGETLYQLKRYAEAIMAIEQAIQIDPDYPQAYAWKGNTLYQLKRYTEALAAFNQAIQLDPDYAWAYGWKGAALYQLKQYPASLIAREQALQKGETNKENYLGKGTALYQLKHYAEAIVAIDQAIQIDPGYTDAYTWKATVLSQQRKS